MLYDTIRDFWELEFGERKNLRQGRHTMALERGVEWSMMGQFSMARKVGCHLIDHGDEHWIVLVVYTNSVGL